MEYNFKKEVNLFMIFDILGDTVRTGPTLWYIDRKRLEDVKDHVLDLILIFKILEKYLPTNINKDKIINYIICHDLPEAITGDITKFEGVSKEEIKRVTSVAINYLSSKFDDVINLSNILNSYEERVDLESKIVHMIDKVHSSTTFIKYQSEQNINMNDSRIIKELRNHPFVVEKIAEGKDLADIFFEFHLMAVNFTDEECEKYNITRAEADNIVNVIKAFATEMHDQKSNNTLLNFNKDFPQDAMDYNRKVKENKYRKLVRDNIPEICISNGEKPIFHVLDSKDYWNALLQKDTEELQEVKEAEESENKEKVLKELGDKLELIRAMAEYQGFTLEDVIKQANKKKETNGGFQKKLFLEAVIKKEA